MSRNVEMEVIRLGRQREERFFDGLLNEKLVLRNTEYSPSLGSCATLGVTNV
jgi:hypothetical protein